MVSREKLILIYIIFLFSNKSFSGEIHAHRGGPGKDLGDSSIEALHRSISQGVDYIEFDVQLTSDKKFVVSHDSTFTERSCGCKSTIYPKKEKYHIYQMTSEDLQSFMLNQTNANAFPLLDDYVKKVELINTNQKLSIELKYEQNGVVLPDRKLLVDSFMLFLYQNNLMEKVIIQSFDQGIFEEIRRVESSYANAHPKLAFLYRGEERFRIDFVSQWPINRYPDWNKILKLSKELDLNYFSPRFSLINSDQNGFSQFLKNRNRHLQHLKVVPWTVNSDDDIKRAHELKVDGILTDEVQLGLNYFKKE